MEFRTLRYFLAVAHEQSMTRAAKVLQVTQSTLSKQVKSLERELGQRLFVRHSPAVRLTGEGELLLRRAEDLIRMADQIEAESFALGNRYEDDLYFGLVDPSQIRYLAREIGFFRQSHPKMCYHITSGDRDRVTERLDRGVLDFVALAEDPNPERYEWIEVPGKDRWGVIMPECCELAGHARVTVDELLGLPLFCCEQSWDRDITRWAGDRMRELNLEGSFRLSCNGSAFVREGLGYLLGFDRLVGTKEGSGLCFRPLAPTLKSKIYLIWRRRQVFSPIAEQFLEYVRTLVARQADVGVSLG